jgi:hypothetical protein
MRAIERIKLEISDKERMRRVVAIMAALVCLPAAAHAPDAYAAILQQYVSGDADAAITKLTQLPSLEIQAGLDAFDTTRSRFVLTGAARLHTEVAFRGGPGSDCHLQVATAIVEFGERAVGKKTNTPKVIHPRFAAPVSDDFRRLWYCAVINGLEGSALLGRADGYLEHAVALFPESPEVHLLAGVAEEMHASPRVTGGTARERRHALDQAETHFRAVLDKDSNRLEARLRLARALQQGDKLPEARALLASLTSAPDDRIAYLAALFLGGIDDREGRVAEAAALYARAAARLPEAQTARLAASEIQHRSGDRQGAADVVVAATGPGNVLDPWWTYVFGEYWRVDLLLAELRAKGHA